MLLIWLKADFHMIATIAAIAGKDDGKDEVWSPYEHNDC